MSLDVSSLRAWMGSRPERRAAFKAIIDDPDEVMLRLLCAEYNSSQRELIRKYGSVVDGPCVAKLTDTNMYLHPKKYPYSMATEALAIMFNVKFLIIDFEIYEKLKKGELG